jgi:hypothetical protein
MEDSPIYIQGGGREDFSPVFLCDDYVLLGTPAFLIEPHHPTSSGLPLPHHTEPGHAAYWCDTPDAAWWCELY